MGHGIASNSVSFTNLNLSQNTSLQFYRRPPQQQRTQYAHQHDISSPKRGYGPYRSVPLGDPNRSHEFADEEDLPFINDPSNNDNLMDTSQREFFLFLSSGCFPFSSLLMFCHPPLQTSVTLEHRG